MTAWWLAVPALASVALIVALVLIAVFSVDSEPDEPGPADDEHGRGHVRLVAGVFDYEQEADR